VALSYRLITTAGDLLAALLADLDNRRPLGASAGPDHPGTASQ
jgi:hypothetical protein